MPEQAISWDISREMLLELSALELKATRCCVDAEDRSLLIFEGRMSTFKDADNGGRSRDGCRSGHGQGPGSLDSNKRAGRHAVLHKTAVGLGAAAKIAGGATHDQR